MTAYGAKAPVDTSRSTRFRSPVASVTVTQALQAANVQALRSGQTSYVPGVRASAYMLPCDVAIVGAPASPCRATMPSLSVHRPTIPARRSTSDDGGADGTVCEYPDLDFFGSWGRVTLSRKDAPAAATHGVTMQAGTLGTDFLSVHPFTLDYEGGFVLASQTTPFCSDAELAAAGFVSISTAGFYARDTWTRKPLGDVIEDIDGGTRGAFVPNVPAVPLRIAGVDAVAQLDTGFDDVLEPHAMNVNQAFLAAIVARDPRALVRNAARDLSLTTCVPGVKEDVDAYELAPGYAATIVALDGTPARVEPRAVLFAKHPPRAAARCGGIGMWHVPAAQMAASYFVDAGIVVFDPVRARVWMPPTR